MIDPLLAFRNLILSKGAITALTGNRIYAGVTYPPGEYVPGQYAITLNSRGGSLTWDRQLLSESFTVKCYGASELDAMTLYRTVAQELDQKRGAGIRNVELEISGFPLTEPDPAAWPFVLCYFRVLFNSQLGA